MRWKVIIEGQVVLEGAKPVIAAHFIWTQLAVRLTITAVNMDTGREEVFVGKPKGVRLGWVGRRLAEPMVEDL